MNKVVLNKINKNIRYRTFQWQDNVYLLDCDERLSLVWCPILAYLTVYKCYQLSSKEIEQLHSSPIEPYHYFRLGLSIFLVTSILLRQFSLVSLSVSGGLKLSLLFLVFIMVLGFRWIYSRQLSIEVADSSTPYILVRLYPSHLTLVLGKIVSFLIILVIVLAMVYGVLVSNAVSYLILFGLILFILLLSFANISFLDLQDYDITIYKEKISKFLEK